MEQFLDYRQVPTATEANENTESIKENGHVEKVKEPNGKRIQQKGLLLIYTVYVLLEARCNGCLVYFVIIIMQLNVINEITCKR